MSTNKNDKWRDMMRVTIRSKILIIFGVTLIITGGLNLLLISRILKKDYKNTLYSELMVLGGNLETQIKRITSLGIRTRDIEGLSQQCKELVASNEHITEAMVIDENGRIIFHNKDTLQNSLLKNRAIVSSISAGKGEIYSVEKNREDIYYAVIPFGDSSHHIEYAVVIGAPAKIIDDKITLLISKCNVVLLSTFGAAALLLLFSLSIILTSPLASILKIMKEVTKSKDLKKRVNISSHDEIGQIADAFNKMTEDLENSTTSMDKLNAEIAERKRTEQELQLTQFSIDNCPDNVVRLESNGVISYANNTACRVYDYSQEEIVGLHIWDIDPNTSSDSWDEKWADTIDKGSMVFESLNKTKSGMIFPVEVSLCHLNFQGRQCLYGFSRDISGRKRSEYEIKESDKRFKQIVDNASEWIWEIDSEGLYTYSNTVVLDLLGYKPEEVVGKKYFYDFFVPENKEELKVIIWKAFGSRQPFKGFLNENLHKNGHVVWLMTSGVPIVNDEGDLVGYRGSDIDMTVQKQSEEQMKKLNVDLEESVRKLEDANKNLKDFVYVASHDLREPLRKITSFGQLLKNSLEGNMSDDDKENLDYMVDGAKRLTEMIDGLLIYSRVNTRRKPFKAFSFKDMIEQVKEFELAVLIEENRAVIEVPEELPEIYGDESQITLVIQNLIANGVKYQKKGNKPHITIKSKPAANGMVKIGISDNGIGIPPEYHQAVFNMFRRLHTKDEYKGTGIGLAICKKIVERHGGTIEIESVPGRGSTFWFTVPASQATAPVEA